MAAEIQIKGTRQGLVICLPPAEFEDIKANLCQKMEQASGFFRGARFSFRSAAAPISDHQQQELEQLLSRFGLLPVEDKPQVPARPVSRPKAPLTRTYLEDGVPAMLVDHGLRSGQDIRAGQEHAVILGDVHPGALVESAGNVLIMGRCAGTICAGADGDTRAVVVALGFASPNLSIAGTPAGDLVTPTGCQDLYTVRLKDGKVVL